MSIMISIIIAVVLSCEVLLRVSGQYIFADRATLVTAVDNWVSDEASATATYGEINTWDVSGVTDMSGLFQDKTTFNSDISAWNVSSVTSMGSMFKNAAAFNSDISAWDVSSVTGMGEMFRETVAFSQQLCWKAKTDSIYHYCMFCNSLGGGAVIDCIPSSAPTHSPPPPPKVFSNDQRNVVWTSWATLHVVIVGLGLRHYL